MKKAYLILGIFAFFLFFSLAFSSAQTQVITSDSQCAAYGSGAYTIMPFSSPEGIVGKGLYLDFAIQDSNSKPVSYTTMNTTVILTSRDGYRFYKVLQQNLTSLNGSTIFARAFFPGTFLNTSENYNLYVSTTDGTHGGCLRGEIPITPTGTLLDMQTSFLYGVIFIFLLALLSFSIYGLLNSQDKTKEWIIGYLSLAYLMLFFIFFLMWSFSTNYLYMIPILGSVFWILWFSLGIGWIPFEASIVIYMIKKGFAEKNFDELVGMGYSRKEALSMNKKK